MPRFLITLPPMPMEEVKSVWTSVLSASGGSDMVMNRAYIDANAGQAICCWDAPDQDSIEDLFSKAGVQTEFIREVVEYSP